MSVTHHLKILPPYFKAFENGRKNFEIRKNDRGFREGDSLCLHEWEDGVFTGQSVDVLITYVTDYMQKPGYVVLGTERKELDEMTEKSQ
ncbi:DUF3850 domain-containing protein [Bacillus haynesii]|uniref:ASCH/PUA domain-containing protein n=1 Tax=Bacillus haynesii TaxID=1925021 RepID=UPI00227E82AE|nr:ASCH/PUA domain-containing protein [Bacillus haynesii]MCY8410582.1 DUF3850 domain-containing protein [Bacillus haynesii]MCY8432518.1 DUF3850 domain-containing protein [Bacillus haynesii]MCY8624424.1 DUF3850 domain-containing protein [Bacillus haynesii]MCY8737716.1 DUF3850 domain-containing protein [Bacillus haynesii]